jgi:uncharacterized protein (TIGR02594 family)
VNYCVASAGLAGTNSKWAQSWKSWGREAAGAPQKGDIVVYKRSWKDRNGKRQVGGHVGFLAGMDGDSFAILGGNQSDRVSIAPYPAQAGKVGSTKYELLSIRRPVI